MKALQCQTKHSINLKLNLTILDAGDFIQLLNLPNPLILVCALENGPFLLEWCLYSVINGTEFCECFGWTILFCQNKAAM